MTASEQQILPQLVNYVSVDLPSSVPVIKSREGLAAILENIAKRAAMFSGQAVIIEDSKLPTWYLLMLYHELSKNCSEVAVKKGTEQALVLFSLFKTGSVMRSAFIKAEPVIYEPVKLTSSVLSPPPLAPRQVDLSLEDKVVFDEAAARVLAWRQEFGEVKRIVFSGETDCFTALVIFAALAPLSDQVGVQVADLVINF